MSPIKQPGNLIMMIFAGFLATSCENSNDTVDFVRDVKPILEMHCIRCHNDKNLFGGLNLMTQEKVMQGSANGPVLIPGYPKKSLLYKATRLEHGSNPKAMPATGPTLNAIEKELLRRWIQEGATWPEGSEGNMAPLEIDPSSV